MALVLGLILLLSLWIYFTLKRKSLFKQRQQHLKHNTALLLNHNLPTPPLFSSESLHRATDNFRDNRIITTNLYTGILDDGTTVTIKKSQTDHFITQLSILSQTNHKNIPKLLGCCLETKTPILVYNLSATKTLYNQLHSGSRNNNLSWKNRMRIAVETAEALACLHSVSNMYQDVKSSNILLDDCFTAKLVFERTAAKGEIYGFGVVLVEMLMGEKVDGELGIYFLWCLECRELGEFIDGEVMRGGNLEEVKGVAEVARKCLLFRGEKELENMKEVGEELRGLAGDWINEIEEEDGVVSANISVALDVAT